MKYLNTVILMVVMILPVTAGSDFFSQMGLTQDEAKDHILDSLFSGQMPYQIVTRAFLAAPVPMRIGWIRGVFTWAKTYTRTDSFLEEYQVRRKSSAPQGEEASGSFEDETARQQAEFRKQIEEMQKNLKQMPAEMRPQMEQAIKEMEAQFKELNDNPDTKAIMKQGYEEMKKQKDSELVQRQTDYEKKIPHQPRQLIVRHLRSFLDLVGSIDFSARTEHRDGYKKFINTQYESKPNEWKLLYRAGRETVDAARVEAEIWLAELVGK